MMTIRLQIGTRLSEVQIRLSEVQIRLRFSRMALVFIRRCYISLLLGRFFFLISLLGFNSLGTVSGYMRAIESG